MALIEFATIVFSLPGIFIYRGFLKGILFNSVSAMSRVAELKNLIVDYSPSEPPVGARLKDFTILDGRIDRSRIESALLAILGRVSEEYANAIENVITTPALQMYPCRISILTNTRALECQQRLKVLSSALAEKSSWSLVGYDCNHLNFWPQLRAKCRCTSPLEMRWLPGSSLLRLTFQPSAVH